MWRWLLPALCALATIAMVVSIIDVFGVGSKPWFGFWDSVTLPTERPFIAQIARIAKGGASARAGIRNGDRIDLRSIGTFERAALLFQPVTTKPITFVVLRNGKPVTVRFFGSTQYEGNAWLKTTNSILWVLAYLWALGCAWLVGLRRWQTREGRYLCLTLLAILAGCIAPETTAWPNGFVSAAQYFVYGLVFCVPALLPVALAASFGVRSVLRRSLEVLAAILAAIVVGGYTAGAIGALNASIDPLPFIYGALWPLVGVALYAVAVIALVAAIVSTARSERARTAWLLLPIPVAVLIQTFTEMLQPQAPSWEVYMMLGATGNAALLIGAAAVTYALLKRRVLDVAFVISRALVVAGVSAIVVASFVFLEWLLGTVLASASHATGVVANAGLALVLGLSMSFIHKRVDAFVDFAFFHRRHENEHALRDFAKEAAFVTSRDTLLDHAIERVRAHTDAGAAAVLLDGAGTYKAERWYGDRPAETSENDGLVLALKASHKPVDPHRHPTALIGDVALPMLARGRLLGVLLCGPRNSGEAYAPDEVDALAEFAQGIGSALESIDRTDANLIRDDAILSELRALRAAIEGK